jgi:hypothetical protein
MRLTACACAMARKAILCAPAPGYSGATITKSAVLSVSAGEPKESRDQTGEKESM